MKGLLCVFLLLLCLLCAPLVTFAQDIVLRSFPFLVVVVGVVVVDCEKKTYKG